MPNLVQEKKTGIFQHPTTKYKIQSIIWNITGKVTAVRKTWQLQD